MAYRFEAYVRDINSGKVLEISIGALYESMILDRSEIEELVRVLKREFPELME